MEVIQGHSAIMQLVSRESAKRSYSQFASFIPISPSLPATTYDNIASFGKAFYRG